MQKQPPVLLDCDDVLLDWLTPFRRYAEEILNKPLSLEHIDGYDLTRWLGLSCREDSYTLVRDFNQGEDTEFSSLPAMPGAAETIDRFRQSGRRMFVITACSTNIQTRRMRIQNLLDRFGSVFEDVLFTDLGQSKEDHLSRLPRGDWVEDNHLNAEAGLRHGHRAIVLRDRKNRKHEPASDPALVWADTWPEIEHILAHRS